MSLLATVNSNDVSQAVIDDVEGLIDDDERHNHVLTFDMAVSQRDAEYVVETLRLILTFAHHHQSPVKLSLDNDGISDEAIDVFARFMCETTCHLQVLILWQLRQRQVHRLLAALHTNRSVTDLRIFYLQNTEGALWIADLLRHKRNLTHIGLVYCHFSFLPFLPLLREQQNLTSLIFVDCRINGNDLLLFHDPEITQSFVDNLLLSPSTQLKVLFLTSCGVSLENGPLMAGIHKNTTVVELRGNHEDAVFRRFIDPILRRNVYLGHVHDLLGKTRTTTSTLPATARVVGASTITPPCGLWATVLAKVGQGTQGASPVFTILSDRLATWMVLAPSPHTNSSCPIQQGSLPLQPETASPIKNDYHRSVVPHNSTSCLDDGKFSPFLEKDASVHDGDGVTSSVAAASAAGAANGSKGFLSSVCDCSNRKMEVTTTRDMTVDLRSSSANGTESSAPQSPLQKKRAASPVTDKSLGSSIGSKKPKSAML